VHVIPSIDLDHGRSRVVFWPGVATGVGAPTDRPERIAESFVERGARLIHLVDFDGARTGMPGNLEAVGTIASRIAVPLQVAGGVDTADGIRLAFAAGATRVVTSMAIVDDPTGLADAIAVAGAWLAVGLDPRPERLAAFPWHRAGPPTLDAVVSELADRGVSRFVLAHGGRAPDLAQLGPIAGRADVDVLVAGGATDLDGIRRLRDAGIAGIILGEALLSGAIDFSAALEAAA
jgi:phosphoribosylformimino-5-aminoimidazole carboxamide ribotide isomerase